MITSGSTTFLFAPEDNVQAAILQFAAAEQTELCVGAYALTLAPLIQDLIANHTRGLAQQVLCDLSQEQGTYEHPAIVALINAGVDVVIGTAPSGNILHSKYLLGKSQGAVFSGSYNFSQSATIQDNCSQVFAGTDVWAAFRAHFASARAWVVANEPQDQIRAAVAAGVALDTLRLGVPVRFSGEE